MLAPFVPAGQFLAKLFDFIREAVALLTQLFVLRMRNVFLAVYRDDAAPIGRALAHFVPVRSRRRMFPRPNGLPKRVFGV